MRYFLPLFSVLLGYFVAVFFNPKNKKNIKLLLAFSGAFLLSITVMHLLPEVYENALHENLHDHSSGYRIGFFIMVGILFQIILEFFSKGAEHGHVHKNDKFDAMPWSLFISLCIHAFLEGMPVGEHNDLALGIAIHHFPIAMILTSFFLNSRMNSKIILLFMLFFSLMTPLGTIASEKLYFIKTYYTEISAIVIGILFHISSTIIFESSENHKFNTAKISVIVFGIILAYFV